MNKIIMNKIIMKLLTVLLKTSIQRIEIDVLKEKPERIDYAIDIPNDFNIYLKIEIKTLLNKIDLYIEIK